MALVIYQFSYDTGTYIHLLKSQR